MFYDEDTITDQPERQIVAELIREKALHMLEMKKFLMELPFPSTDEETQRQNVCTSMPRLSVSEIPTRELLSASREQC